MLIHCARSITSTGYMAVRRDKFSLAHSAISAIFSCSRSRQQLRSLVQWDSCIEKERIAANDSQRTCYHTGNKKFANRGHLSNRSNQSHLSDRSIRGHLIHSSKQGHLSNRNNLRNGRQAYVQARYAQDGTQTVRVTWYTCNIESMQSLSFARQLF